MLFWITGSKGLLGKVLVERYQAFFPVVATGKEVDIQDPKQILDFAEKNPNITHIINCAAFSAVDEAEKCKKEAFGVNALGPEHLAKAAQKIGAKLIHISSDYVFRGDLQRPLSEKDPTDPCSYYGETKLEGEKRALSFGSLVIRTSWLFGSSGKNFVSNLLRMLKEEKEIFLTEDQWGRFTYAKDLADAILNMQDKKGLFQYANEGVATRYEFALKMKEEALLLGLKLKNEAIIPVSRTTFPSPAKRPIYSAFDTSKIAPYVKLRHWHAALKEFLCESHLACL